MYFDRTLEDWIGFKIDNRTKFDLSISSGLCLLAAQKVKKKKKSNFETKNSSEGTKINWTATFTIFAEMKDNPQRCITTILEKDQVRGFPIH